MSRVVASNTPSPSLPFHDKTELEADAPRCVSPTLGQLLERVGDARKEATGDHTPLHHQILQISPATTTTTIPFVLSFTHLTYSIKARPRFSRRPAPQTKTTLLDDISGEARDGEIMAVMGASGSGKSTLIDALANRIAKGSLKGSVTLNGEPLDSRLMKVISAYVMQDDLLYPMLTVEETLMFAAEFRLPRTLSRHKKHLRVQALIDQLGLRNAANTIIGDEGHRGVSGGERRRVSIGIDIVHDPILLFLDEPTSGLDSTSAFLLVNVLQRIARSGSLVIMSIHQPSYRILGLLDQIFFLSRGKTVYRGPPSDLPQFFSDFGHPIPENENRTEFALDLIRELETSPGGTQTLVQFNKSRQISQINQDLSLPPLKEAITASISRGKLVSGATKFANPWWIELAVLSRRSITNSRRTPEFFGMRLATVMVTGFILATVFWRLDTSPRGIQERLGFFAFAMSTTFYACADALPVFLQERYIFMRETAHNAYRRSSYVLSHALTSLPALMFLAAAFAAATYWAVGLDGSFLYYFMIMFASFWAGSSFVTFLSGIVPQVMLGYVIVVAVLAYYLLFSGFFINRNRIPVYWIWFHYMSLIKYPYEGVLRNEFEEHLTRCFARGIQMFDGTPLGNVTDAVKEELLGGLSAMLGMNVTRTSCVTTGADVLKQQGVTDLSKWDCLWVTVAWGFLFRILFYLALLLGSKNKRR